MTRICESSPDMCAVDVALMISEYAILPRYVKHVASPELSSVIYRRDDSFCSHTILQRQVVGLDYLATFLILPYLCGRDDVMVVLDCQADWRFARNVNSSSFSFLNLKLILRARWLATCLRA